ncbi:MAG: 50S ribosomal protein L25/general stress protein Ctc [Gammaproteobacteria bacterium]|nr:50S ribosomal protein L25/general stress protein Ctc [Gammaproteobacteria bacterium]CAJ2376209.1 MAG: 50S ribosomal protein L25 [Arenicellales bacterium IbO2]MDA7962315.1 50S ribosomal protein L25/general stress protein Ctc [Gammaproteobacteria bacterium]MDA7967968.1 50S ribosomal protein L25/general stress protein Ctc [Gammaproteobacteria bacterium]MDA7969186.1 50S ribosomal protein L25/general stress protein Ctc [Gammaproteobacteria bacterium]
MSDQFELIARKRARSGTALVRRLRREGDVPAVLYGGGKENLIIAINHDVLFHSLEREEFHSAIIVINTDGNREQAILRDVVRHPHKNAILHADFQRVEESKILTMSLPIHFTGESECVGVRMSGGIISHLMTEVEISCLPKDLPESLSLDVAALDLHDSLHLSDIKLPEGVQITSLMHDVNKEHDHAVVAVLPPKVSLAEEEEEAKAAEGEEAEAPAEGEPGGDAGGKEA